MKCNPGCGKVLQVWMPLVSILIWGCVMGSTASATTAESCAKCDLHRSLQYILLLRGASCADRRLNVTEDLMANFTRYRNINASPAVSFRIFPYKSNVILVKLEGNDPLSRSFIFWLESSRKDLIHRISKDRIVRHRPQALKDEADAVRALYPELLSGFKKLHSSGLTGSGIRVAVFDTGLTPGPWTCKNLREVTVWTGDDADSYDRNGHGTAVAGVLCSPNVACPGLAPDIDLLVFKLYSETSEAMTSWFLGALEYAMHHNVDLINLSIGGPDYLDEVFMEKIQQAVAQGITVVSAVGNAGPLFGTAHNPADMAHVIAVGGVDSQGQVAEYSSRGMTTWELYTGNGCTIASEVLPDY